MKLFSTIVFVSLLSAGNCFSQGASSPVFYLSKLPSEGVLLDKGWKFQRGDDTDYAKAGYDDSKWQPINPSLDVHDLPQLTGGIAWFRLHFFVDSNLFNGQLALGVEQSGASEIYLNGKLIHRFGVFSTDLKKVRAYDPYGGPIGFPVKIDGQQCLAIRYALQPGIRYSNIFGTHNYAIRGTINTVEDASQNYRKPAHLEGLTLFIVSIFVMLTVIHLSFFLFYRAQKANLYFSLFALFTMTGMIIGNLIGSNVHWVEYEFYLFNFGADLIFVGLLLMVTALYQLLEQKRRRWYSTLVALSVLGIIAFALPNYLGWAIGAVVVMNLINLEITRISFIAVKKKKRGAWIIAAGCLSCLVSWALFFKWGHAGAVEAFTNIVFALSFISIPVAVSIYLGADFAFTNKLLRRKLTEVDDLSQKTIAQEKEKQQILSSINETLEKQVTDRTAELNHSLENLKATQKQLIQAEKMASLGELTAGIAHEIQNPLNFVNNFSEVNTELVEELQAARSRLQAERNEALEDGIINDIKQNLEKINHHGKRADAIVKGMLQHSRISTGQKELTDINKLADEYLKLAYHGFKAKDRDFNAVPIAIGIRTDLDATVGKISIVPQDIGRVLLNLINNAFYAVGEKLKAQGSQLTADFKPLVSILTKKLNDKVEIRVKDNGDGIPNAIVDKIFQPFFTTKPTGQGTGLGLSLAYDIIKAHGGEIKVETKEVEGLSAEASAKTGSEFIINLPVLSA
jgi:signal transduction histidine kinase